jgi:mRNA interferase MazF
MSAVQPSRGEVWFLDLNPTQGREQAGTRPALVVSVNRFNHGPAELAVVIPITSRQKGIPLHVPLVPPEGGVKQESFIKCEDVRSVSTGRFFRCWGRVSPATMQAVEDRLRILMGL